MARDHSLLAVKIFQGRRKVVYDNQPVHPHFALLFPLHIQELPDALRLIRLSLPLSDLHRQGRVQPIEDDEEPPVVGIDGRDAPHLDDVGMADHGQEAALHGQVDHPSHEPLGILHALVAEDFDGVPGVLSLAEAPAGHELAILHQDAAVVPELAELVFLLVDDVPVVIERLVEGSVGLYVLVRYLFLE